MGRVEELSAEQLFNRMQARFEKYGRVRKSFVTHLFHKAETTAHLDHAMDAFYYSQSILIEPNEHMVWEMLNACIRVGEPRRALELFAGTYKFRIWPIARQFNRLMGHFLNDLGDHQSALETYEAMLAREVKPNASTYALLVRAHAAAGDHAKAHQVAEEATRALGSQPPQVSQALQEIAQTEASSPSSPASTEEAEKKEEAPPS